MTDYSIVLTCELDQQASLLCVLGHLAHFTPGPVEVLIATEALVELPILPFAVKQTVVQAGLGQAYLRNCAAALATGSLLLFLASDVLLDPLGVAVVLQRFKHTPHQVFYGYVGSDADHRAPSRWLPGKQVNYLDLRFIRYGRQLLEPHPALLKYPHWFAWGEALIMPRHVFQQVGGYDVRYQGRGGHEAALMLALHRHQIPFHFCLDLVAERLCGELSPPAPSSPGKLFYVRRFVFSPAPEIRMDPQLLPRFLRALFDHYLPQDTAIESARRHLFALPTAEYEYHPNLTHKELRCHESALGTCL